MPNIRNDPLRINFPEETRLRFKNFIKDRTGLYFRDNDLKDLDAVVAARMKVCGFETVFAYYSYLTTSEKREDELRELLNRLTINHTYFFRNEPQFKVLKEKILPELIERKLKERNSAKAQKKPAIRIWSAGCSTGEEPYTAAMLIIDIIPDLENWGIEILATDASTEAIERARMGIYSMNSMRLVDDYYKSRYFTERANAVQDERFKIGDEVRRMVNFSYLNLVDEEYPKEFDIIFCRNVTIYFDLEDTVRVMNKMERSLDEDGYLFIGYSETLQFISDKFKMINLEDAIFYRKTMPAEKVEKFIPPPASIKIDKILEELSMAEFKAEEKAPQKAHSAKFEETLIRAIKAVHAKDYQEALSLIEEARIMEKSAVEPDYLAAEICANQARFNEARENIRKVLDKNAMFAPAYYLLGSICAEEGNIEEGEKSYKKAIYLEEEFLLAHFSLANIYKEKGNIKEAIREYRNTLTILSKSKPYDIIAYSGGFNAAALSSVCRDNIARLKVTD